MSSSLRLKYILHEVLKEVGELTNITPYKFTKTNNNNYTFITDDNIKGEVSFKIYPIELLSDSIPNDIDLTQPFTNIQFELGQEDTQYKKSDYKYLIKAIKTVFDITMDYLKTNHPQYILISATHKEGNPDIVDPQKTSLYQSIMLKNLHKLPNPKGKWGYKILNNILDIQGQSILLYNKK